MAPETPRSPKDIRSWLDQLVSFLEQAWEWALGINLAGSWWMRLLIIGILLIVSYNGLDWLVGGGLTKVTEIGDVFRALREDVGKIGEIIRNPVYTPTPSPTQPVGLPPVIYTPEMPLLWRIGLFFRQFGADKYQNYLAFLVLPFLWAVLKAWNVFEDAYHTGSLRAALGYIFLVYVQLFLPSYKLSEGNLIQKDHFFRLRLIGGPARLDVQPENLGVLENSAGQSRVVGAMDSPHRLRAFERLYRILTLQEYPLELSSLDLRTRDGIVLGLKGAHFSYFLSRGAAGNASTAADPQLVQALVYRHWVGKDWEDPQLRQRGVSALVKRELEQFVASLDTLDILPCLADAETRENLRLDRKLLSEFVQNFNQKDRLHGLQLRWHGDGTWEFPPGLTEENNPEAFQTSLRDRHLRARLARLIPHEYAQEEIRALTERILDRYETLRQQKAGREAIIQHMLNLYHQILGNR